MAHRHINDLEWIGELLDQPGVADEPRPAPLRARRGRANWRRARQAHPVSERLARRTIANATRDHEWDDDLIVDLPEDGVCPVCRVTVGGGPGNWESHVEGIRHRRNALRMFHYGDAPVTVVSAFESEPPEGPRRGRPQQRPRAGPRVWPDAEALRVVHTRIAASLRCAMPDGVVLRGVLALFDADHMAQGRRLLLATQKASHQLRTGERLWWLPSPFAVAALAWECRQAAHQNGASSDLLSRCDRLPQALNLVPSAPDDGEHSSFGIWSLAHAAACAWLLLEWRPLCSSLECIQLLCGGGIPGDLASPHLNLLVRSVLTSLGLHLAERPGLRTLILQADNPLRSSAVHFRKDWQQSSQQVARDARLALLASLRARGGALNALPRDLLTRILDQAVPRGVVIKFMVHMQPLKYPPPSEVWDIW